MEGLPIEKRYEKEILERLAPYIQSFIAGAEAALRDTHRNKPFHNEAHTRSVVECSTCFLNTVSSHAPDLVSEEDRIVQTLSAWAHDLHFTAEKDPEKGVVVRRRGWEEEDGNEWRSYVMLGQYLGGVYEKEHARCQKEECDQGYLGALNAALSRVSARCKEAIHATLPEFAPQPLDEAFLQAHLDSGELQFIKEVIGEELKAVCIAQPSVAPDTSLPALSVAIGDLSQVGQSTHEAFVQSGNGEFRELNYVLDEAMEDPTSITSEQAREYTERYLSWSRSQVGFVLWQWIRFESMLAENQAIERSGSAKAVREALRQRFSTFKQNALSQAEYVLRLQADYPEGRWNDPEAFKKLYQEELLRA